MREWIALSESALSESALHAHLEFFLIQASAIVLVNLFEEASNFCFLSGHGHGLKER